MWRAPADHRANLYLVRRVRVRVQEAHGDRLHALGQQAVDGRGGALTVERCHHLAAMIHLLANLAAPSAWDKGQRPLEVEIVEP